MLPRPRQLQEALLSNIPKREGPRKEISHVIPSEARAQPYDSTRHDEMEAAALAASARPREDAERAMVEKALRNLKDSRPDFAVRYMRTLPVLLLELHILAEEHGENRKPVLMYFPKPSPKTRERFERYFDEAPRPTRVRDAFGKWRKAQPVAKGALAASA